METISINRGITVSILPKTIIGDWKGCRFSGLNIILATSVVWIKHHRGAEISIGLRVRSLEEAFL